MKKLKFIFGKLSIFYYILFLVVTCILCKSRKYQAVEVCIFCFRYLSGNQSLYLDWLPDRGKGKPF